MGDTHARIRHAPNLVVIHMHRVHREQRSIDETQIRQSIEGSASS